MPAAPHANRTGEATIFARLLEAQNGELSAALARYLLKLGFSPQDKTRMHELAVKNQEGRISAEELDSYIKAGDLLAILQSKARKALKKGKVTATHHG
jgi:hypothetical protein